MGGPQPPDDDFLSWSVGEDVPPEPEHDPIEDSQEPLLESKRVRGTLEPGTRFDEDYVVEGVLGRGAMGVVYRARDKRSGGYVALKVLSAYRLSDRARIRLRREGELTAALRHPGIVGIHSAGEVAGVPYLAYELIPDARTLETALSKRDRLGGVELIRQAAEGLGHAHAHGVIHRDVKPTNVLVDARGLARVADFGLARAQGDDGLTRTGALVGTPGYMSPEQLAGERERTGPHTDVWALGVILYEHLTGRRPFEGENLMQLSQAVWEGRVTAPRSIDPTISRQLEAVCLKCLAIDPSRRYPGGNELARDLANALADRPVTASSHLLTRIRVPRLWRAYALGALGLLFVVALAWLGWRWLDSRLEAGARQTALRDALIEVQAGGPGQDLAELLEGDASSPAGLRARSHLALARLDDLDWSSRELHARLASELDASLSAPAGVALGEALRWQGRAGEAAEAYRMAVAAGADEQVLLDQALAHLEAGEDDAAAAASARFLERRHFEARGLELLARAQLQGGELEGAQETIGILNRMHPGPIPVVLSAQLELARGQNPYPLLDDAADRWPAEPVVAMAMATTALERSDSAGAALAAVGEARSRGAESPELDRFHRFLSALVRQPPDLVRLRSSPETRRLAAGRWLDLEGRRLAGIYVRSRDANYAGLGVGEPEPWRQQAEVALRASRELLRLEDPLARRRRDLSLSQVLEAGAELQELLIALRAEREEPDVAQRHVQVLLALGDPTGALVVAESAPGFDDLQGARLRCQALLELGRKDEALPWLARGLDAEQLDLQALREARALAELGGWSDEQRALQERLDVLEGKHRQEATAQLKRYEGDRRHLRVEQMVSQLQAVLDLWPLFPEARLQEARVRFVATIEDRTLGMVDMLELAEREPQTFGGTWQTLTLYARVGARAFGTINLTQIRESETPPSQERRLLWTLLNTVVIQTREQPAWVESGLEELNSLLREQPDLGLAWLFRGLHHLWAGRLALCRDDLQRAGQAMPTCGVVPFLRASLLAAEGAPAVEIREQMLEARALDYYPYWHEESWEEGQYPWLRPYLESPELDFFFHGSGEDEWREARGDQSKRAW